MADDSQDEKTLDVRMTQACPARTNEQLQQNLRDFVLQVDGREHFIKTVVALDNLAIEGNADAGFDKVTGMVMVVDSATPVNRLSAMMTHLGGKMVSVKLPNPSASDEALQQLASKRAIASNIHDELRAARPLDLEKDSDTKWGLQLGHGARFSSLVGRYNTRGQRTEARLVVDAGMEAQAKALVSEFAGKSIGEMLNSQKYQRLMKASDINARGLAAVTLEQLDLEDSVHTEADENDVDPTNPYHQQRPLVSGDQVSVAATSSLFASDNTVTVFSGAIDTQTATGDHLVVPVNAHAGVDIVERKNLKENTSPYFLNAMIRGAPRSTEPSELSAARADAMMSRVFYQSKGSLGGSDSAARVMSRVVNASDETGLRNAQRWSPILSVVTGH